MINTNTVHSQVECSQRQAHCLWWVMAASLRGRGTKAAKEGLLSDLRNIHISRNMHPGPCPCFFFAGFLLNLAPTATKVRIRFHPVPTLVYATSYDVCRTGNLEMRPGDGHRVAEFATRYWHGFDGFGAKKTKSFFVFGCHFLAWTNWISSDESVAKLCKVRRPGWCKLRFIILVTISSFS